MDAPTTSDIQALTRLEALKAADAAEADPVVAQARSEVRRFTGLSWANVTDSDDAENVKRAVRGMAELLWIQQSPETLETMADFDLVKSFSAGSYSETRRDAEDAMKAKLLVAWPWLSSLLWGLMTPEKKDEFLEQFGDVAPAWSVSEMDWGAYEDVPRPGAVLPGNDIVW
jgi:hypothetical protein